MPSSSARPTVARGLAVLAATAGLLGAFWGLWEAPVELSDATQTIGSGPVCGAPVELAVGAEPARETLACVGDVGLRGCEGVVAGDRVERGAEGACRVTRGGMRASWRLLTGLPLSLNRASASELALLDGIGPKLSAAIVTHRQTHGPFASVEALIAVKGIGPVKLSRVRARLAVD